MNDLVLNAKNGNRDSLLMLYGKYKNCIFYFCTKLIDEREKAEELVYDTFTCAFERLSTLEDTDQFEMWLKNIAAIKCFNYIRKMKPMLFLQVVGDPNIVLFNDKEIEDLPHGEIDKSMSANIMDEICNRLNDDQRMTLMLRYYNNLTVSQTAKIMNSSEDIVKIRLEKAAETMKNTVNILDEAGVKLTPVDFRTVLGLMSALITVPSSIDRRIDDIIDIYAGEDYIDEPGGDNDLSSGAYPIIRTPEAGSLEEATLKYSAGAAATIDTAFDSGATLSDDRISREKVFERFMDKPNIEETPKRDFSAFSPDNTSAYKKTPPKKQNNTLKNINPKVKITAIALAVIIVLIIIIASVPGKDDNENTESNVVSTVSTVSEATESVVSEAPVLDPKNAVVNVATTENEDNYTAQDGTVLASAVYSFPKISIADFPETADKINGIFEQESEEILSTYQNDEAKQRCDYMYAHPDYGEFKKDYTHIKVEAGRTGNGLVSFIKSTNTFAYGNTHDETEEEGMTFSVKDGKKLTTKNIMSDYASYIEFAKEYVAEQAKNEEKNGKYSLYENYAETIENALTSKDSWYINNNGIVVIFNPDELVYYSYGVVKIQIPIELVTEFMKDEYK